VQIISSPLSVGYFIKDGSYRFFTKVVSFLSYHKNIPRIEVVMTIKIQRETIEKILELSSRLQRDISVKGDDLPPEFRAFVDAVSALPHDEQCELVAMLYLGRGDFSMAEWDVVYGYAQNMFGRPTENHNPDYYCLMNAANLERYLKVGWKLVSSY